MEIPKHLAIIMDGNGRWAVNRGKPRTYGHRAGLENLITIGRAAKSFGVTTLTIFTFSSENWQRPEYEVQSLLDLLRTASIRLARDYFREPVRVRFIGDRSRLPERIRNLISLVEERTAHHQDCLLQIAFSYGGRQELVSAFNQLADRLVAGDITQPITEADIQSCLWTDLEPDLIIRTGGEMRLSNFMLWQAAYTELLFTDTLWPDFSVEELEACFEEYARRDRRFGALSPVQSTA